MAEFKPKTKLDYIFEASILLKAIDGFLEIIGGAILLIIDPSKLVRLAQILTQHELSEDPQDFLAGHILHSAQNLTGASLIFASVYLLSHGIAKLILVIEILRDHLWAYVGLIVLTSAFIVYQIYRISYTHSISLILFTIFDIFVVWLTFREYNKQKHNKAIL